ncbi:MAG: CRISPR system precrRNA processing endoribonuclease RAMP protein Cas6 [Ktedonobacteraceae bacterium]
MLTVHCLEVVAEAATTIALDTYCGSAIRGAFFRAIWGRFCTNRESPTCSVCPLATACPVAALVAPMRDEPTRGRDAPRPYIISAPKKVPNHYVQGEVFTFGLSLIGGSAKLFPYVVRSLQAMESSDFGHPLPELQGRRGRFSIRQISAYHPLTGEREVLWEKGSTSPQKLELTVTPKDVAERARQLPTDHITINFLSPTRLIRDEQLITRPDFQVLMLRLYDRLDHLQHEYGEYSESKSSESRIPMREYALVGALSKEIRLAHDETRWADIKSYSARQRRAMPIGGFVGRASFEGDLTYLRELLVWGEVLHVGKNAVKGGGLYRIEL